VSKTGWANSDAIFLSESTNVSTPAPTPAPTPEPTPPPTTAPPCAGCPALDAVYYGINCDGQYSQYVYSDGCCGQYAKYRLLVDGQCGYTAPTPPPTTAPPTTAPPVNCSTGFNCSQTGVCSPLPPGASANCRTITCTKAGCNSYSYCSGPSCP
jgi:hypothetical protein